MEERDKHIEKKKREGGTTEGNRVRNMWREITKSKSKSNRGA
jgi:hypothetical protein